MFNEYVLIVFWIGFAALVLSRTRLKKRVRICGEEAERYPWLAAFLYFLPVIVLVAARGYIGDTAAYIRTFNSIPDSFSELGVYYDSLTKDRGFYMFSALIKLIFGNSSAVYLTVIAVIQGTILVSIYRKYSYNFFLSIFLFIVSTDYISWMCNGIRQFLAALIIFAATRLIIEKKYISLVTVIIFASLFHQTALLMLPIVFIVQGEAWNKKTLLVILAVLIAVVFIDRFTTFLDDTLVNTQYQNVVSDYTSWNDDGTHPLRVAVYSVPAMLALFGRKTIREEGNKLINISINMSIISMGLYLISMATSGIFMGRLPIYCSLYGYIALPWQIKHQFKSQRMRQLIYFALIVLYLFYYYYQMRTLGII